MLKFDVTHFINLFAQIGNDSEQVVKTFHLSPLSLLFRLCDLQNPKLYFAKEMCRLTG